MDSAGARPVDATGGVIVAGMGGSASGARLARRRARARGCGGRCVVSDGYALPGWAGPSTLVLRLELLGQHRGDARGVRRRGRARRAAARGHDRRRRWPSALARDGVPVVPLPGGFQPRAAIGYSLVVALEAAALARRRAVVRDEIEAAAALAAELAAEWGPDGPRTARPSRSRARCTGRCP